MDEVADSNSVAPTIRSLKNEAARDFIKNMSRPEQRVKSPKACARVGRRK